MNYSRMVIICGGVVCAFLTWKAYTTFVTAPEQGFIVESRSDYFEIRSYQSIAIAQTNQKGSYAQAMSAGFKALANYIFAKNRDGQKIAMTAPVLFAPHGKHSWDVRFVLPDVYTKKNAPQPADDTVRLQQLKARRIAVRGVKGAPTWGEWQKEEKILREQLAKSKLRTRGRSWYARYNPPWIPSFMRRNEIMIELGK